MRSTAVWLSLYLLSLTIGGQTAEAQLECRETRVCKTDEKSFCCLAAEEEKGRVPPACWSEEQVEVSADIRDTCNAALEHALPHRQWETPKHAATNVGVIIASLPSPFRTGTASLFDPALEGLIAALSDENFVRDRSWLWDIPETAQEESANEGEQNSPPAAAKASAKPPPNKKRKQDAPPASDAAAAKKTAKPERSAAETKRPPNTSGKKSKVSQTDCSGVLPGVMLFRREGASSNQNPKLILASAPLIVVFIVGESPVWGLDHQAIRWAVEQARKRGRLHIVGPYFSGSATSMQRALSDLTSDEVWMASGTSTVIEQAVKLVRFQPEFAVDTRAARRAALADFVRPPPTKPEDPSRVALFREDATAFGSYSVTEGNWLDFPISPSVSRVRSAHAKLQRKRAEEAGILTPPWLDATLDHDPSAPDLLPTTSPSTIIAEDLKFDGIVQVLRRHRISNVGIHLHAAEDVVFATQHLRQAMPEVRPLLLAMDRTFLHPQYAATMDGALVASAYIDLTIHSPASNNNSGGDNKKSDGKREHQLQSITNASAEKKPADGGTAKTPTGAVRVFSRDSGPGVYRATRSLFHRPDADYSARISEAQRTSQLGVIRRGKVWPLTSAPNHEPQARPAVPVEFVALLLCLLCLSRLWPVAIAATAAFVDGTDTRARTPQSSEGRCRRLSCAAIWLGTFGAIVALGYALGAATPLANRLPAVLSGVSPLAEVLLGLGSVALALAGEYVVDVPLPKKSVGVAMFGALIPFVCFIHQLDWAFFAHALTVESTWLGPLIGTLLLFSYIACALGLATLHHTYLRYTRDRSSVVEARRVTVSAACCLLLALLFLAAVNEYPFHPGRVLESFAAIVLVVTATCAAFCYSHLESSTSTWKVWAWALIPLFIALGTYYPGLRHAIQEWFELRKTISSML
jgi:hypothetical protein